MSRRKKIIAGAAGMVLILLLFSITILPSIVKRKAIDGIRSATGRTAAIEKLSINPFTLGVTVTGFRLAAADGGPFVSIAGLHASLSPASLYRRAPILSEITVDSPSIVFSRSAPNRYSFTDIIERTAATKKPETEKKSDAHFSINNIAIRNGSLDFEDQAVPGTPKHTIRKLELAVPFISTIPYLADRYIDPKLSAMINGAPFTFSGKLKPLSKSMETAVSLDLQNLNLPELAGYLPQPPPVRLASGRLSTAATVSYRVSADKKPELSIAGSLKTNDIAADLKDGSPLLRLPLFEAWASKLEVFSRRFAFQRIALSGCEIHASRNRRGTWMYEQLLPSGKQAPQKKQQSPAHSPGPRPQLHVAELVFENGTVRFRDDLPAGGFKSALSRIDFSMKDLSTEAGRPASYRLSLQADQDAALKASGEVSLSSRSARSSVELTGLRLQAGWPYLSEYLTAPVKGILDLSGEVSFNRENGISARNGGLKIKDLSTRYGNREGLDLALLAVTGASYEQKANRLIVEELRLARGGVSLSREADGTLSPLSLLKLRTASASPPGTKGSPPPSSATAPPRSGAGNKASKPVLSYRLQRFQADGLKMLFTDKNRGGKPTFSLRDTKISLNDLQGPRFTPARLRFATTFNKNTPIRATGLITPSPFRYRGDLNLGRLQLMDFEEYFPDNLNVFIIGGSLDTSLKLDIGMVNGKPAGSFSGSTGIRDFHSVDTVAEEDLLKWESLQLDEFQGNLEPFSLAIRQIALNGVYSRIIIRKDGTLNLQDLVQKPESGGQTAPGQPPPAAQPAPSRTAAVPGSQPAAAPVPAKPLVTIGAVTIQEGTLSFTDNHLPQQFATTFFNLGGRVSGLSSEETKLAEVDLRGNLENHSPLQITGKINPLRDDLFVDLKVAFKDIELSPVTPYTGTYLGYAVEKGKLYLDLKYHIEKKELNSENRIFVDQFTFGKKIDSDKATSLPVRLGLALLKDRKGEIHLDVPVTGRTDDPQFSIWRLVFQVLRNLLVKAATSPFSLLSSMFGGGADLSTVQFASGSSVLQPAEETKLAALAKALADRPALKMELKGFVERDKDAEGYRAELLNRKIRNEKFLSRAREQQTVAGETAETTTVTPEEQANLLKAVYRKEKFPKPRNVFGLVKDLPESEMRKLIIANTIVGDTELAALAKERSMAVMDYLVKKGNIPAERIFLKQEDPFRAPEKETGSRSRVELNIIAQ